MTLAAQSKREILTYDDYAKLPEGAPYQLVDGEMIMTPAAVPYHQVVSKKVFIALWKFAEDQHDLGTVLASPIDVRLDDINVFQPDIIFISKARLGIIGEKAIDGAPDLVVEILSPSTAYYDLKKKKTIYARSRVKEYWIVDPIDQSVEVHENTGAEFSMLSRAVTSGEATSKLLDGFTVKIEKIF